LISKNTEKTAAIVIAAVLFLTGQFLFIVKGSVLSGTVLMVLAGITALLYFAGIYDKTKVFVIRFLEELKNQKIAQKDTPVAAGEKKGNAQKQEKKANPAAVKPVAVQSRFSISFSKNWLLGIVGILFIAAQFFFFKQRFVPAIGMLAVDVIILMYFVLNKSGKVGIDIEFEKKSQVLLLLAGIMVITAGWFLLTNRLNQVQNIGVIVTTIGLLLAFFGLPENKMAHEAADAHSEILFVDTKILNNYFVKAGLIIACIAFIWAGNKLMPNNEIGIFSMAFFAAGIAAFFFAMPIINFKEIKYDNAVVNILKLLAVLAAVWLAYSGQKYFTMNRIGDAILRYLAAAAVFITMFPVSSVKDKEEPVPLKFEYAFVIGLTLMALFLRLYQIDSRPYGIENDEAGGMVSVVKNFWVGQHPIYANIWELFYKVFGINRIGLRMSGIVLGTISVPVMYFAIRTVLNVRTAMFASVLFAFLRWNLHYGRSGHGTILAILATTLAVYFIFKAINKRDKFTYFMAGMMSGLCWYGVLTGWFVVLAPLVFIVFESFTKKEYFKRNLIGVLAFLIGFWIFGSQHIKNYFISSKTYFSRISEVSVFSQDPNAPAKNPAIGIVENTQRVLLMFNHQGDSRQRNSGGMPYEPTVDFVTAMLFGVGFLYCIYYSKYYAFFILVMIFFSQAAGSIFAIEAPSAMRAVGTMIPVIFFAAVIFNIILRAFNGVFKGKIFRQAVFPLIMLIVLFPIVKENYKQYFQRWIGGMDELSTSTGTYAQKLGESYRINLYTGLYYPGHPPFRIFRWDYKIDSSKDPVDNEVKLTLIDDENYAIFFHYDVWHTENLWKEMYPEAKFDSISHPGFGKMFDVLMIQNEEIKKMRGLKGTIAGRAVVNAVPGAGDAKPAPYTISLEGKVMVPYYGAAVFGNTGNARVNYAVDGIALKERESIRLAKGMHNIRINVSVQSAADTIFPVMYLSRYVGNSKTGAEMFPLNEKYLYTLKNNGLRAVYYSGDKWNTPVNFEEITPVPFYIRGGQSNAVKLSGYFNAAVSASYKFNVTNNGFAAVIIDGVKYWDNVAGSKVNTEIFRPGMVKIDTFSLSGGRHKIEIYTLNSSQFSMKLSVNGAEARDFGFGELEPDYSRITYN